MTLTQEDFELIITNHSKCIKGDISWLQHSQHELLVIALPINVRTLLNFVTKSKLTIAYCPLPIPVSSSAILGRSGRS
jgi:hypothetical protein